MSVDPEHSRKGQSSPVGFDDLGYTHQVLLRVLLCAWVVAGCSRPLQTARTSPGEPTSARESSARSRLRARRCSGNWAFFPGVLGVGQFCHRKDPQAAVLALGGIAELATGITVGQRSELGYEHPAAALSLLAYQDLWVIGVGDVIIDRDLAGRKLYAPTDSLADLVAAPFNLEVMKRPSVWAGLLVATAIGVGASIALEGGIPDGSSSEVNVFGRSVSPLLGYSAGFGSAAALFSHVAPAEELLFRGVAQSSMARAWGETEGWLGGSLLFGAIHAPNAFVLPEEDRRDYLVYGLPVITVVGSYLGYLYKESGYSLAPPTAVHFWYDFLLTSTFFIMDPQNSPLSASVSVPF